MSTCPWCGIDSPEDDCPWCQRSKTRQVGSVDPGVDDRCLRALLTSVAVAILLFAVGLVFWVGLRPARTLGNDGMGPIELMSPAFTGRSASPPEVPSPRASRLEAPKPPAVGTMPKMDPVPQRFVAGGVDADSGSAGGVVIRSAHLSVYDNGMGHPSLVGMVEVSNHSASEVADLDLRVRIGERAIPLSVLGPETIAKGCSAAMAVRADIPSSLAVKGGRCVEMTARLRNPPGGSIDSFKVD